MRTSGTRAQAHAQAVFQGWLESLEADLVWSWEVELGGGSWELILLLMDCGRDLAEGLRDAKP